MEIKIEKRICQNCENEFIIDAEDFAFYEKIKVPPPTFCPECRLIRRLAWRNERTFYWQNCKLCKKKVLTIFNPLSLYAVYCNECYNSDKWDSYKFGIDYDPQKPFFEQLKKLIISVPKQNLTISGMPNIDSEYITSASGNKNCYLVSNAWFSENCAYCRGIMKCKDSFDIYFADSAELCYQSLNIHNSSNIFWGQNIFNSLNLYFCFDCTDCQNCFGCIGLRHKSYHFLNESLSKELWTQKVSEILGSYKKLKEFQKQYDEFKLKFPRKENNNFKAADCAGDYIFESKNLKFCFESSLCEDCKYGFSHKKTKDSYDVVGFGSESELLLETVAVGVSSKIIGSYSVSNSYNLEYCIETKSSHDCIGCDGLKNAEFCILNKQYTEKEYFKIRNQIIEELKNKNLYGEFFPSELSPFSYNETTAQDYFPLTKEEAILKGYKWKEREERNYNITTKSEDLPDNIHDTPNTIIKEIIECENHKNNQNSENTNCATAFKIIPQELEFYRKMNLPLPRLCPNCRHSERIKQRNPLKLWKRKCNCAGEKSENNIYQNTAKHFHGNEHCTNEFETTYSPERKEIVYCEACYKDEIY